MTHRQIIELCGHLAEHGVEIAERCRGISTPALRRYAKANETRCRVWGSILLDHTADNAPGTEIASSIAADFLPVLQEIATSGVLTRQAATIMDSIGRRLDIPLAIDVAAQSVQDYGRARQAAIAAVTLRSDISREDLDALDRLGRLCDRLSDLLCGALIPHLKSDRFVVDRERALDFAETFGRRPALVRVPVRKAARSVPDGALILRELAEEVEKALVQCLPSVTRFRSSRPSVISDLEMIFRPRLFRGPEPSAEPSAIPAPARAKQLAFPTLSFSSVLRQVTP